MLDCKFGDFEPWVISECKKRGWTLNTLEEEAGIRKNSISKWGKKLPSDKTVEKIANVFGVTMPWIEENIYDQRFVTRYDIYTITCSANRRVYVGRTRNPYFRWKKHLSALKGKRHSVGLMQADFNKYGESNFKFEIIAENVSGLYESIFIKKYGSLNPRNGYNYLDSLVGDHRKKEDRLEDLSREYGIPKSELKGET